MTTFALSSLDGTNGFGFSGIFVQFASTAGDVDGDGFDDLVFGLPHGPTPNRAYVVFGGAGPFSPSVHLPSLINGADGFAITGGAPFAFVGYSVDEAGDINGDGLEDILVGAPNSNGNFGAVAVVFGATSFPAGIDFTSLTGGNGFLIDGALAGDRLGVAVSNAGDVNGDGIDDLIIGAPSANNFEGAAYVLFGKTGGLAANFSVSSLNGSNGFALQGPNVFGAKAGGAVAAAGDVNGDGIGDIIVGATFFGVGHEPGGAYVVFGRTGFSASVELSALNGVNGFAIRGPTAGDNAGQSLAGGDVNGDGFDDLLIGAPPNNASGAGAVSYVVFGKSGGFNSTLQLSALNGSSGFAVAGFEESIGAVRVVAGGDMNGDGLDDFFVEGRTNAGSSTYVIFGSSDNYAARFDLALLSPNVLKIPGSSAVAALDFNGDGIDDISVSGYAGPAIIFGAPSLGPPASFTAATATGTLLWLDVSSSGLVTASLGTAGVASVNQNSAAIFVSGVNSGLVDISARSLSSAGATLNGNASANQMDGSNQNDKIDGKSGNDRLFGLAGSDTLIGGAGNDTMNGGEGGDTYRVGTGAGRDAFQDTGASGVDRIVATANNAKISILKMSGIEEISGNGFANVTFVGSSSSESLNFASMMNVSGIALIDGGGGGDTITGSAAGDTLTGGSGVDSLIGGGGDDTFVVRKSGDEFDRYSGGSGTDTLKNGGGAVMQLSRFTVSDAEIINGAGFGIRASGTGANTFDFSQATLVNVAFIDGALGNDLIIGSAQSNTLIGGGGGDTFKFVGPSIGADIINDFDQNGDDFIALAAFGPAFDSFAEIMAASMQVGADVVIDFGGGDTITLVNTTLASLTSSDFLFT